MTHHSQDLNEKPNNISKNHSQRGQLILGISIVIIVIVLVGGFSWFQRQSVQRMVSHQNTRILSQVASQKEAMEVNVKVMQVQLQRQQQLVQTMQLSLQNAMRSISHDANSQIINQVTYLIHQAHLELIINANFKHSLNLLKDAQQLLSSLNDPAIFNLKTSLAQDIASLAQLHPANINLIIKKVR